MLITNDDIKVGFVATDNKYGPFEIVKILEPSVYRNRQTVLLRFLNPNMFGFNTEIMAPASNVIGPTRNITDPYSPIIYRVACRGIVEDTSDPIHIRESDIWRAMIARCYNQKIPNYKKYGAKGITVCLRWRCFEYFTQDIKLIPNYNLWVQYPGLFELDKDVIQGTIPPENRIREYNPQTTMFVLFSINTAQAVYDSNFKNGINNKFKGATDNKDGTFSLYFGKEYRGRYTNRLAALSMYNIYARANYYPIHLLNDLGSTEMSISEIIKYKVEDTNTKPMYTYVRKDIIPYNSKYFNFN